MSNFSKRRGVSFTTSRHTHTGNDIEGSSVVSFSVSSVWIIDWIQEVQTGRPTHQVESPTTSCTRLSLSLSLPLFLSLSLPFVFRQFVFSSFCLPLTLQLFLSLPASCVHPSLPLSIPPSPLPLFPSIIICWRAGTKNNHTRHFSVIFKGVPSGYKGIRLQRIKNLTGCCNRRRLNSLFITDARFFIFPWWTLSS